MAVQAPAMTYAARVVRGGEFRAEEGCDGTGTRPVAPGQTGLGFRFRIIVCVGVDVVDQLPPVGPADELDAGHLDAVGRQEALQPAAQPGVDAVSRRVNRGRGVSPAGPGVPTAQTSAGHSSKPAEVSTSTA